MMMSNERPDDEVPPDADDAQVRAYMNEDSEQPVRHLFIDWPSASVKGLYTIGASMPDVSPPLFDLPLPEIVQDNAASAVFKTRSSPINVTVNILHGQGGGSITPYTPQVGQSTPSGGSAPTLTPNTLTESMRKNTVFVSAKSVSNSVTVNVPQYVGRRPLHIRCKSTAGNGTLQYSPSDGCDPPLLQRHAFVARRDGHLPHVARGVVACQAARRRTEQAPRHDEACGGP